MAFLLELLYVLGCRTPCSSLVHGATREHRNNGEHLGAGAEFQDGKEICKVISQHVSGHRDGVQALLGTLQRHSHGFHWGHNVNVQASWIKLWEVRPHPLHEDDIVGARGIKPEDGFAWLVVVGEVVGPASVHCKLDPVLDGAVL